MIIKKTKRKRGASLVETVVYTSLLALLTVVAVTSLIQLNRNLQNIVLGRIVDDAAQEIMEKIIREVRFADSVNAVSSSLSVNPGTLVLNSSTIAGIPTEVEFLISSSTLIFKRDGIMVGPLTPNQVTIDELVFDLITTPVSEAVKVSLVLKADRNQVHIEETFNTTVILRGSY